MFQLYRLWKVREKGKAGVFSVFFSWEPEDKVVPAMEKGIKGDPGSSEGESKGPTPLERF